MFMSLSIVETLEPYNFCLHDYSIAKSMKILKLVDKLNIQNAQALLS